MATGRSVGICLLMLAVFYSIEAATQTYYLPYRSGGVDYTRYNLYNDNIYVHTTTSIVFDTKGNNDCHLLLKKDANNYNSNVIEIVIGGWSNTQSVIRTAQQGSHMDTYTESGILSSSTYKTFWISWANNCIKVGKGGTVGSSEFMSWCGLSHAINYISIGYGYGSDGYFQFTITEDGNWGSWSSWSGCTQSCGTGSMGRSRSCDNPAPAGGGADCSGSDSETSTCNTQGCPVDGNWGSWGSWGSCSLSCGTGTQSKSRSCNNPAPQNGGSDCGTDSSTSQNCNTQACPIDGNWASWSAWDTCTATCGGGTQGRTRTCTDPAPQHSGADCAGSASESQSCGTTACQVDGAWTTWTAWGQCTVSCGTGNQERTRSCTNPVPAHGGSDCVGVTSEDQNCNTHNCPIDGDWTTWTAWSACGVTCSSVTVNQLRERTCTNPAPQYNGQTCSGAASETNACVLPECPVDGAWTTWTAWGQCTVSCGTGNQERTRSCTNPVPAHGGSDCVGVTSEDQNCNTHNCPIDGDWTTWTAWSACGVTCSSVTVNQLRERTCTNPAPQYNGQTCSGAASETNACVLPECPVDGAWTTWTAWGQCTVSCGTGNQERTRSCTNPVPAHGGSDCVGVTSEDQHCNTHNCPIDGDWTTWTAWSACAVTCTSVTVNQIRQRTCTNPAPQYSGQDCAGTASETNACVLPACPVNGNWGSWNRYTACSATCLGGIRNRTRVCDSPAPSHGGADCAGDNWETNTCNTQSCDVAPPIDGNWGTWQAWQGCSVTCGTGVQRRYRACDDPSPSNNGLSCLGDSYEENSCSPGPSCPVSINGDWSAWTSPSSCDKTCGTGRQVKVRYCNNPSPTNGGLDCTGDNMVISTCNEGACDSTSSGTGSGSSGNSFAASYVNICPGDWFTCRSGYITCIDRAFICDCAKDCGDGSDESNDWAGCIADELVNCESGAKGLGGIALSTVMVLSVFSMIIGYNTL